MPVAYGATAKEVNKGSAVTRRALGLPGRLLFLVRRLLILQSLPVCWFQAAALAIARGIS
jgi:hypothetical protein